MRAYSRRGRTQGSVLPDASRAAVIWAVFLLCATLGATRCTSVKLVPIDGGTSDGKVTDGNQDKNTADVPKTPDTASPPTCSAETISKSKGLSETCSCDRECQSGFCASIRNGTGTCCSTACTDKCMTCNLLSSPGTCAPVPYGLLPLNPADCSATEPRTCQADGTCDGKGGCRNFPSGVVCKPGTCQGDSIVNIQTCDGLGNCSQTTSSTNCPPYTCDPNSTPPKCTSTCTDSSQCAIPRLCVGNHCGTSSTGAVCTSPGDCSSGFCVDGYCCNVACDGACQSCDQIGHLGHCSPMPEGQPDPQCNGTDQSTCGNTGLCDSFGNCPLYAENTVCGSSTCSGMIENTQRTCDGNGTCRDSQLVDCSPFLCSSTGGACLQNCAADSQCEAGHACVPPANASATTPLLCSGLRQNGQSCLDASQCDSNQCVDGVCCESACTGACRSCNLAGSPGKCLKAANGAQDPRKTCKDLGKSACSTDGVCDGNGSCRNYPSGTVCSPESCVSSTLAGATTGIYTPPSTCNDSGQCVAGSSRLCSPYLCNGSACYGTCTSTSQCSTDQVNVCANFQCGLKGPGASCASAAECKSGFCAQGVCCNGLCKDKCMSCNLTATAGTCTTVPDNSNDPQGICAATQSATCGTTGKCVGGDCAYTARGQNCKAATCATAVVVNKASTCDGAGACGAPATQDCTPSICASGSCKDPCLVDTDCVPPNTCVGNTCGKKTNGSACTAATQCQSGICTEGVCCNTICADATTGGLCKTCKGTKTSATGTCSNVDSGGSDPKSRCSKSNVAGGDCSNDGTCNGSGACRPWGTSNGCRSESCSGTNHTLAANCDGKGMCPAATVQSCGSYVCNPQSTGCFNTCTADTACNKLSCVLNRCGNKLNPGDTCSADSDCSTGFVCSPSQKVCCNQTCSGACQTCPSSTSAQAGMCSSIANGAAPRDTTTCAAAAAGSCGNTGKCNGNNGCQTVTTCNASFTTCADSKDQYSATGNCTYTGTTPACILVPQGCNTGYLCSGKACATSCTADTSCDTANGYSCISKTCQKKAQGVACTASNQCSSGFCTDGVCCNTQCADTCKACNLTGTAGACSFIAKGGSDAVTCPSTCPSVTQAPGVCDGAGKCSAPTNCPAGSECNNGACGNTCTTDAQCPTGYACALSGASGTCKLANGQTCAKDGDCAKGHCVGGSCCGVACTDNKPCGTKALCSSADWNSCQTYGPTCGQVGCDTDGVSLDAVGTCTGTPLACVQTKSSCNGFTCPSGATSCSKTCTVGSNAGCSSGYYCDGKICKSGSSCPTTGCAAGNYCDGVACQSGACSGVGGKCQTGYYCGTDGNCAPLMHQGDPCTSTAQCPSGDYCVPAQIGGSSICCKTNCSRGSVTPACDSKCLTGGALCAVPANTCGTATCDGTSNKYTAVGTCKSDGTCNQPTTLCGLYVCSIAGCGTSPCKSTTDCLSPNVCSSERACIAPNSKSPGASCSSADECSMANCLGNFCCKGTCPTSTDPCGNNTCDNTGICVPKLQPGAPCDSAGNVCSGGICSSPGTGGTTSTGGDTGSAGSGAGGSGAGGST